MGGGGGGGGHCSFCHRRHAVMDPFFFLKGRAILHNTRERTWALGRVG